MKNSNIQPKSQTSKILAWLYLIKLARHVEKNWRAKNRDLVLHRGWFYCRKSNLAKRWGWPRRKVQRFFKKLETEGKIKQETLEGIGTVCKILDLDNAIKELMEDL